MTAYCTPSDLSARFGENELAQVASLGWKCRIGAMLVDEAGARYVRIESGATSI